MAEPECCKTPMVHNSFTGEYECAEAYFALVDDGVLDDGCGELHHLADDEVPPDLVPTLHHWRASRRPDGEVPRG